MLDLNSLINECDEDQKGTVAVYFRMLTKGNLNKCGECECSGFLKEYGITLSGTDASITRCTLMDCICLLLAEIDKDYSLIYSTDGGLELAHKKGFKGTRGSMEESLGLLESVVGGTGSAEEKDDEEDDFPDRDEGDNDDDEDDIPTGDLDQEPVVQEEPVVKAEEPVVEEPKVYEPKKDEDGGRKYTQEDLEGIDSYYNSFIMSTINNISSAYTDMFQSGYELTSFAGVVTEKGITKLSGQSVKPLHTMQMDTLSILLKEKMGLTGNGSVCMERSNTAIANRVFDSYITARNSGGSFRPLYFPYKMLEFAYGRMAPSGDDQNGLTDYPKHANANNWKSYCSSEVRQSLSKLLRSCVRKFVINLSENKEKWTTPTIGNQVIEYLEYLEKCLSICILVVDWKETNTDLGMSSVDSIKIRVCDPYENIKSDIMPEILSRVFSNSTGVDAYSFKPIYASDGKTHVKEYAHEFNHKKAQAMPLFAYKAAEILNEQGVQVNMENMILGRGVDDRILKNEKNGKVDMMDNLTHIITAGSRAGKGVMTLNILAAGIASNRNIFYLDRKPDMASLFQHICPEMFVVNGSAYSDKYDIYGYFRQQKASLENSEKLQKFFPQYVRDAFKMDSLTMDKIGDLVYFRALKLVLSIILALYTSSSCREDPNIGGTEGIMLVVDEATNFVDAGISQLFSMLGTSIPCLGMEENYIKYNSGNFKTEEARQLKKDTLDKLYNDASYYALIYLSNIAKDLGTMSESVNAGADPETRRKLDIFVIGQNIDKAPLDSEVLVNLANAGTGRYPERNGCYVAVKNELASSSLCYNYVTMQGNFVDAFFGNNQNRHNYMADADERSKAKGRIDPEARNFAYVPKFTTKERDKVTSDKGGLEVANANSTVYFKPFLILNDSCDPYLSELFLTCDGNGIPEDVIKGEISDPNSPNGVSEGVGLPGYLNMILSGSSNVYSVLKKSGDIANYVVHNVLGYTDGDWFDFCLDHRLEWMFNMKDLINAIANNTSHENIGFFNRSVDSTFSEYLKFKKLSGQASQEEGSGEMSAKLLTGAYVEGDGSKSESERAMKQLFASSMPDNEQDDEPIGYSDEDPDDYPDDDDIPFDLDEDDYDEDDEEDEDDLDDDPEVDPYKDEWEKERAKKEIKDDIVEGRQHKNVPDEEPRVSQSSMSAAEQIANGICSQDELSEIISRLQKLGFTLQYNGNPSMGQPTFTVPEHKESSPEGTTYYGSSVYMDDDEDDIKYRKRRTRNKFFANNRVDSKAGKKLDDKFDFSDGESIDSFENLVRYITKDVLATYGGRDRVRTFKCKGGSIIINGYVYKCHVGSEMARSLPYDIRAKLGASCVASLYDYKSLIGMRGLSKLSFDDINFVYDYVSTTMGYGNRVSVDLFFNDIPSLRELRIGKKVFTRDNYKQKLKGEDRDMFYQPKLLKRTADFTDSFIENRFKDSWALTVDSARNRKYGALRRVGGVVVGSSLTAATGVTSAGVKVVRKGFQSIHRIANSFKDVFKEYDDIRHEDE